MRKIEIVNKDLIIGNFRASDYGLIIASFSYNEQFVDEIGMNVSTIEEFIGNNPVPTYIGQNFTDKLHLQITLIKNPYPLYNKLYFNEKDCRSVLRILTGINGYQWTKLITYELDEDLWYRARVNNVSYKRIGGHIAGIILDLECDSHFAWSKEYSITINAKANQHFYIYNNTDDLNNYIYPIVSIVPSYAGHITITNINDNWDTEIKNVKSNEKITVNSKCQIITSNKSHDLLLNDFNLKWFRLIPNKNEYVSNVDAKISMIFRVPRKVGFVV